MNGQVPISSLRLNTSLNCSTFSKNSSLCFSSNTESNNEGIDLWENVSNYLFVLGP